MRSFILYLDLDDHLIPIGSNDNAEIKAFSTYNENLEEAENDQYTLTFSIIAKSYTEEYVQWNPLLSFYHIGAKLRLVIDNSKRIDLIIKNRTPNTKERNTEWVITAQDEMSYLWSKQHITQVYSTLDHDILHPKDIYSIADDLIRNNWLTPWSVVQKSRDPELAIKSITLEDVQNNPYQILVEACNTVGACIAVDYSSHTIDFFRKDLVRHSGYRYHPQRNLEVYDVDYSGEETTTWLHVHGGEDANGMSVSIIPPLPQPVREYIKTRLSNNTFDAITLEDIYGNFNYVNNFLDIPEDYLKYIYSLAPIDKIKWGNLESNNYTLYTKDNQVYYKVIFEQGENITYIDFLSSELREENEEITINGTDSDTEETQQITVFRSIDSLTTFKQEYKEKLEKELYSFIKITQQIPYLGQYLIDFKPFKQYMTQEQWNFLYNQTEGSEEDIIDTSLITGQLFRYNLLLQYYSYDYFSLLTQIVEARNKLEKVLGINYLAACDNYRNADSDDTKTAAQSDIEKYKSQIEDFISNSYYLTALKTLGIDDELQVDDKGTAYWVKAQETQQKLIDQYKEELNKLLVNSSGNLNSESFNGLKLYYTNLIQHAQDLSASFNIVEQYPSLYTLIINIIGNQNIESNKIANKYHQTQSDITNNVFIPLYTKYKQFIYENTYENTDELDSISLYNQAITYFEDLNRLQSSHSLTTLDIGSLDAIFVPRLSVGSVISVYNPDTPAMQPYASLLSKVELAKQKYDNLYQWCAHNMDSTQAKEALEKAYDEYNNAISAVLAQYNNDHPTRELSSYTELENILFQDTIIVTGISRVLREPLRDSVTVEQTSRYKSILAKLIKSV